MLDTCETEYCEGAKKCRKEGVCRAHWLRLWSACVGQPGYDKDAFIAVGLQLERCGLLGEKVKPPETAQSDKKKATR